MTGLAVVVGVVVVDCYSASQGGRRTAGRRRAREVD